MSHEIKQIQLVPFTDAEKAKLIKSADNSTKEYKFALKLSSQPDPRWTQVFESVWRQEYGGGIAPQFSGMTVQAKSTIQNLQNLTNALKSSLLKTNEGFKDLMEQEEIRHNEETKIKDDAKLAAEQAMKDALDKLNVS